MGHLLDYLAGVATRTTALVTPDQVREHMLTPRQRAAREVAEAIDGSLPCVVMVTSIDRPESNAKQIQIAQLLFAALRANASSNGD